MSERNLHLDYVKGVLVIAMVIYHTMNYFSTVQTSDYEYIRFITGSFIFISGYIISTIYENKYQVNKNIVCKRLIIRGFKLLIIFTALNLLINSLGITNYKNVQHGIEQYLNDLSTIYISGNSKLTAFPILVPIAYLLIISPIYFVFHKLRKPLMVVTIIIAFCCRYFSVDCYNLSLGIIGLFGFFVGMLINKERLCFIKNRLIIFCSLCIIIGTMPLSSRNILTYSISILILLNLIYDFSRTVNLSKPINKIIILFGQYSLVCYIMQIVFLCGLFKVLLKQRWGLGYETISIFLVTNIFLLGLCIFLNFIRNRYKLIDKSYKLIFS
jgi:peptidoglycan/LPS O-acetylase OafA/YrhL